MVCSKSDREVEVTGKARLTALFASAIAVACVVTLAGAAVPQTAAAVDTNGKPSVQVNPTGTGQVAQYTIGRFKSSKSEYVVALSMTFPAGTNISGADITSQAGTVTVSGQTLTVQLQMPTPIDPASRFTIVLDGIVNPFTPGTYNIPEITFQTSALAGGTNPSTSVVTLGANGNYAITAAPFISMTITTPDAGQSVVFGAVDPGVTTPGANVSLSVNSSLPFTITRAISGNQAQLGLTVAGTATGAKPAGSAIFDDVFRLLPPWTTAPQVALAASVVYTVTQ